MKDVETICVIWDSEKYPDWLLGKAGKDKMLFNSESLGKADLTNTSRIYILAELKWGRNRTDLYGFTIAKKIRQEHKVLCPIILCSFLNKEHFRLLEIKDADILKYPGHYLLQLPDKPSSDYQGLDEDTLEDINLMMFDPDQKIHELMHATSDSLPGMLFGLTDKDEMKSTANTLIDNRLSLFRKYVEDEKQSDVDRLMNDLKIAIENEINNKEFESDNVRPIFNVFKDKLYDLLPSPRKNNLVDEIRPHRWEVLFIDDHDFTCKSVFEKFKKNGIHCHTATSASKAFEILRKDEEESKRISMIITDYRLYENGNEIDGDLQEYQGYRILNEIAFNPEFKSHYAFAILTSAPSAIKRKIQKRSKFHIQWFDKSDVLGGGSASFNVWCNSIIETGKGEYFKKRNIPNTKLWTDGKDRIKPGLAFYYKQHVMSQDYIIAEKQLNRIVKNEIEFIEKQSEIEHKISSQPSFGVSERDQNDIKAGNFERLLRDFRQNILLARRIYWVLRYAKSKTNKEIVTIFKKTSSPEVIFQKNLGISISSDIYITYSYTVSKNEMLEEEIDFLLDNYADEIDDTLKEFLANENHEGLLAFFDYVDMAADDVQKILSNRFRDVYGKLQDHDPIKMEELNSILVEVEALCNDSIFKNSLCENLISYFKSDGEYFLMSNKLRQKLLRFNF